MFMSNNAGRKFQNSLKRLESGLAEKVENGSAQLSSGFSTITTLYVRKISAIFDPPSPLVRIMTALLLHKLIYWILNLLTHPSPLRTIMYTATK